MSESNILIMKSFIFMLIMLGLTFKYRKNKNEFVVGIFTSILFGYYVIAGIQSWNYFLILVPFVIFLMKQDIKKKHEFIFFGMLAVIVLTRLIIGYPFKYCLMLCVVPCLIASIMNFNNVSIYFVFISLLLSLQFNYFEVLGISTILMVLNKTFISNSKVISVKNFKKYYIKNGVAYKYIVISFNNIQELSKDEKEELINFLDIIKDSGIIIQDDDYNYIIAYSDIKVNYGTSKQKIDENNDGLIDGIIPLINNRFRFPIVSNVGTIYRIFIDKSDDINDCVLTIKSNKKKFKEYNSSSKRKILSGGN